MAKSFSLGRFVFHLFAFGLAAEPGPKGVNGGGVFADVAPYGLVAIEADFVLAFPLAFLIAAKMRQIGDP
jgi:hypothetical protein